MELLNRILSILFPKRCSYCGIVVNADEDVCNECKENLPRVLPPFCDFCGANKKKCNCNNHSKSYSAVIAPFYYNGSVKNAIKRMKFSDRPHIAKTLSQEMTKCIDERYSEIDFDIITCVPMSKRERNNRGYNQSELLAKGLKVKGNPTIDTELLVKLYDVPPQHSLDATTRQGNVLGIFYVQDGKDIKGKTVLLCDDVKTTGATANECASVLLSYGAKDVFLVCAAISDKDR